MIGHIPKLDERDQEILRERIAAFDKIEWPRDGDYVRFPDERLERVSHSYYPDWQEMEGVQTSESGSWYFGSGYCSFSGGLNGWIPGTALRLTEEKLPGQVWFFHHDHARAHNGVNAEILFRVYESTQEPR